MRFALPEGSKYGVYGLAAGAVVAMVVGFNWGGWMTGGTADKIATERAKVEVTQALTPYCVALAKGEPEQVKLLKATDTYRRSGFIQEKTTWLAGMDKKYHYDVAIPCATRAVEALEAAAKTG